jgi:hypothetical protein
MAKNPHAEGASKALNKTISEIEAVLAGAPLLPTASGLRDELRATISKYAQYWFRRGFRRGCIVAHRGWKNTGKFPKKSTYDARRDFFDGRKRPVNVSWKRP